MFLVFFILMVYLVAYSKFIWRFTCSTCRSNYLHCDNVSRQTALRVYCIIVRPQKYQITL